MSCVAEEKPNRTAPIAIISKLLTLDFGSTDDIRRIESIIDACANNIQARRRPSFLLKIGMGKRSTSGAQTNLNE